jgi:hypothetical protein
MLEIEVLKKLRAAGAFLFSSRETGHSFSFDRLALRGAYLNVMSV